MNTEDMKKGYSKEEEYFYRINKELIERKRKEIAAKPVNESSPHWMKCPKCSADMNEIDLAGIKVDQCVGCRGIYFDHGELEILIDSQEPKGFLGAMKRLFN